MFYFNENKKRVFSKMVNKPMFHNSLFIVVVLLLILTLLLALVNCGGSGNVTNTAIKAGKQLLCFSENGLNGNVCSYSSGGFHIVCDAVPWTSAATECATFGYQPANLDNENMAFAIDVYNNCLGGQIPVWIESYNGYSQDPCMWMDSLNRIFMADPVCPVEVSLVPICQEYVLTNATVTITTSTTVSRGISTVVVPTYDPAHCQSPWLRGIKDDSSSSSSSSSSSEESSDHHWWRFNDNSNSMGNINSSGGRFIEKSMEQIMLCPVNVCSLEVGPFRVIDSSQPDNCTIYGWDFADVTTGDMEYVARLFAACRGSTPNIFIRSYNGISGTCAMLFQSSVQDWPQVVIANDAEQCNEFGGLVLCDTNPQAAYTGTGVASALQSTTTTWTTTLTVTSSIPTFTSTLTSFAATP